MRLSNLFRRRKYMPPRDVVDVRYGSELKQLRDEVTQKDGLIKCYKCGADVCVDLKAIEAELRQNMKTVLAGLSSGNLINFGIDWSRDGICKRCKGVLCPKCTEGALDSGVHCCPKCNQDLFSIQTIVD